MTITKKLYKNKIRKNIVIKDINENTLIEIFKEFPEKSLVEI